MLTVPTVPLIAPSDIRGDPKRRRRVQILHETVHEFEEKGAHLTEMAAANLERWAAAKSTQPSTLLGGGMRLEVVQGDLLETVHEFTKSCGVIFAGLNMANATYPGGGYTTGCTAQEENMARRTGMHFTFTKENTTSSRNDVVYTKPMQELIAGKGGVVYLSETPLVCIKGREEWEMDDMGYKRLVDGEVFPFIELRSAAVDISHLKRVPAKLRANMTGRVRAQFETLKRRGVRHVVLSAFGCGAFGNRPEDVAAIYKEVLAEFVDALDVVVFAIYYAGHGENNFDVFHKTLIGSGESQSESSGNANGKRPR
mgnify:CR=1 FL=1